MHISVAFVHKLLNIMARLDDSDVAKVHHADPIAAPEVLDDFLRFFAPPFCGDAGVHEESVGGAIVPTPGTG